ncbi:MAG: hypothetical protein DLM50_03165 [Candidatus Meridianibacter frigidus]|nr:MAG: hypothetical protein DLM50_03165 [Candidatus Eremiobacteraeota bacterium]
MADRINLFFAYAPIVVFALIVLVVYFSTRGQIAKIPIGQTFACNACGHRDKRDHMVPVAREGSVLWYCHRCVARL